MRRRLYSALCRLSRRARGVPPDLVGARGSDAQPYRLFELAEVEGRRVVELLLWQISCKFCLASDLKLTNRHGDELITDAEEATDREDHCRYARMVEIDQHVFDLTDGCVTLIHFAPNQL